MLLVKFDRLSGRLPLRLATLRPLRRRRRAGAAEQGFEEATAAALAVRPDHARREGGRRPAIALLGMIDGNFEVLPVAAAQELEQAGVAAVDVLAGLQVA